MERQVGVMHAENEGARIDNIEKGWYGDIIPTSLVSIRKKKKSTKSRVNDPSVFVTTREIVWRQSLFPSAGFRLHRVIHGETSASEERIFLSNERISSTFDASEPHRRKLSGSKSKHLSLVPRTRDHRING